MKVRRYKRVQRLLSFYRGNFGFVKPFRVLADGTFCMAALENRINLREQLPQYLNEEVHLMTTACVLRELECLGDPVYGALHIARQLELESCGHNVVKSAAKCVANLQRRVIAAGDNSQRYFVGTQDRQLTEKLREIAGTPILFIKFNALLLEKPADASIKTADDKTNVSGAEKENLTLLKRQLMGDQETPMRRKRKLKGPNPLSCKKKTKTSKSSTKSQSKSDDSVVKQKRKRKRKRNVAVSTT